MSSHTRYSNLLSNAATKGAAAGLLATVPMTAVMLLGRKFFLRKQDLPLPPQRITEEFAERLDLDDRLDSTGRDLTALWLHFTYGALNGAGYAMVEPQLPLPASIKGIVAGLAVWVGSYLGWLPATGILQPATRHPRRLNILMILAHIVWGLTLGVIFKKLNVIR